MNSLDILFWLLIALLGGVAWAIEAGLTNRHRNVLLSSTLAAFASILFIMFWIDDNSVLELGPRAGKIKMKKKIATDGEFEKEAADADGGGGGSKKAGSSSGSGGGGGKGGGDGKGGGNGSGGGGKGGGDGKGGANGAAGPGGPGGPGKAENSGGPGQDYSREPFEDCQNCPEMVIVPKGTFNFGSPAQEPGRQANERTATFLTIGKPFAVSRLEILRGEFEDFVKRSNYSASQNCDAGKRRRGKFDWRRPGYEQDARHPVTCVTYDDARRYTAWLSQISGREYRLLSEMEWEYMARGGSEAAFATGRTLLTSQANFNRSRDGSVAAGSLSSNGFGLADVHGNLAELTADCSSALSVKLTAEVASSREPVCMGRVVKGGSWNTYLPKARIAAEAILPDGASNNKTGLRVARAVDERDDDKKMTTAQMKAIAAADKAAAALEATAKAKKLAGRAAAMKKQKQKQK